jgi:hypothetical protein
MDKKYLYTKQYKYWFSDLQWDPTVLDHQHYLDWASKVTHTLIDPSNDLFNEVGDYQKASVLVSKIATPTITTVMNDDNDDDNEDEESSVPDVVARNGSYNDDYAIPLGKEP